MGKTSQWDIDILFWHPFSIENQSKSLIGSVYVWEHQVEENHMACSHKVEDIFLDIFSCDI